MNDEQIIRPVLSKYYESFKEKTYAVENNEADILMDIYGVTPEQKRENRQYWGREFGMMWQLLVARICCAHCREFQPALRVNGDEPCDLILGRDAIDTKYRIGSGDSGTLKKFKQYGKYLSELGYRPVLLILREDNLHAAIQACQNGGWYVLMGGDAFNYLYEKTGVDVYGLLASQKGMYLL